MRLIDDTGPEGGNAHEFSVSEISGAVKRVIEGEWVAMRNYDFDAEGEGQGEEAASAPNKASGSGWAMFGWFLTGILAGGLALLAWAWFGDIPAFLNSIR